MARQNSHILKILTGAQSGVDVSLSEGEYVLGSGAEDDLQFLDVSLKSGHARLKIEEGAISVAGGEGGVKTNSGANILAGDEEWRNIDALDLITIGTTVLAVGSVESDWGTIINQHPTEEERVKAPSPPIAKGNGAGAGRFVSIMLLAFVALVGVGWIVNSTGAGSSAILKFDERSEVEIVRSALNEFQFGRNITVRQEVDGAIFANGFVERPVERRALVNAINETGVPVRARIWVRSVIQSEISATIENYDLPVEFSIDGEGTVLLSGTVLDENKVSNFIEEITQNISGIKEIDSEIKTAENYLTDVNLLAQRSELSDSILFRLDGELIEASGIVVPEKLDNWVGFIQSYARRYADHIPLRSFVQLVDQDGQVIAEPVTSQPGAPIIVGPTTAGREGVELDLQRLKEGSFDAGDVFQGFNGDSPFAQVEREVITNIEDTSFTAEPESESPANENAAERPLQLRQAANAESIRGFDTLLDLAQRILSDDKDTLPFETEVEKTMEQLKGLWSKSLGTVLLDEKTNLAQTPDQIIENRYLPLIAVPTADTRRCWTNSSITYANLPITLFWLDFLSVTKDFDISNLNLDAQALLLEAGLNPKRMQACAALTSNHDSLALGEISLFLNEVRTNPEFIQFIVRKLDTFPLNLSGVNIGTTARYIQAANGVRINERASPNPTSRLISVGELGLIFRESDKISTIIYDASLRWKSEG